MNRKKNNLATTFSVVSLLGALFVATEGLLQAFGKSICAAEGCKLVAQYARYGDISILLFGFVLFSLLTVLSIRAGKEQRNFSANAINLVLVVSLASEGFFTGYQAFRLHTPCVFCLIVFGFIVALGVIRLLQREWVVMMGFGSLAAVFCLFYLVLPVGATNPIPGDKELVLFYGKDCKYCAEVLKVLDEKNIPVEHVLVNEYAAMLKNMGIEHVPTLYVNYKNEKVFVTGKDAILSYLQCSDQKSAKAPARKGSKKGPASPKEAGTVTPFELNGQGSQNLPFQIVVPPAEGGACRSDENCK